MTGAGRVYNPSGYSQPLYRQIASDRFSYRLGG